jgi:alkylation response protein AidB-like acyl-CoA dehydrogenase
MQFAFSDEQAALKREARRFLERSSAPADVRRAMEHEAGFDRDVWHKLVELGWTSLTIPEEYGGAGLGAVELAAVLEEMGGALLCAPFFSTVCLATTALLLGASDEQKREWLPAIAEGRATGALAVVEVEGRWDKIEATARRDGGDFVLRGRKSFVVDGHTADLILVAARDADATAVYLVPAKAPGLVRHALQPLDPTRKLAELELDDVRVPLAARLPADGARLVERTLERARVALAAEQVGGAERCLALSVDYAKTRVQFGRPIGSFQAIKHKCADMLMLVESARSACYHAAFLAATDGEELPIAAALAHSYCSEAYFRVAAETIQVHGGIGFTWEHDAHLYFRRARSSATLLGEPRLERERLAQLIGL